MESNISFEQAITELEDIVNKLESGEVPMEESINYYIKGIELKKYCQKKIDEASLKIEKINIDN